MSIRKKLPSVVLLSALAVCVCPTLVGDTMVSPGSASIFVGHSVDIPVNVTAVSDLFAFQFDLTYDPAVLKLLNISEGSFLPAAGFTTFFLPGTIDNNAGTATATADVLIGAISGESGDGELAVFSFEALSPGTRTLSLSNVTLYDSTLSPITFFTADGQVIVPMPEPRLLLVLASALLIACKFRT